MSVTKLYYPPQPREGAPEIHFPRLDGCSAGRPYLRRLAVTGERPLKIEFIPGLPDGLSYDSVTQVISGTVAEEGSYPFVIHAGNRLGSDRRGVTLEFSPRGLLPLPLMGWTSWNAFASHVDGENVLATARAMCEGGLADYGYEYINIDSTWQGGYGGEFNAIEANEKFPDMAGLCRDIHALGLRCGIYSTPMLMAWGYGKDSPMKPPGCTRGARDMNYGGQNGGIGVEHYEDNNARQWAEWGFDYLKYDWKPCDPVNARLMRDALDATGRDFGYCITVSAGREHAAQWRQMCNSWRDNPDSKDDFTRLKTIITESDRWVGYACRGHYPDLDMLETVNYRGIPCRLSEDEQILAYTVRAIFPSPLQLSCRVELMTEFDRALHCNAEVIDINQDPLCRPSYLVSEITGEGGLCLRRYARALSGGSRAIALLNIGEREASDVLYTGDGCRLRDAWAREYVAGGGESLEVTLPPHSARLFRTDAE